MIAPAEHGDVDQERPRVERWRDSSRYGSATAAVKGVTRRRWPNSRHDGEVARPRERAHSWTSGEHDDVDQEGHRAVARHPWVPSDSTWNGKSLSLVNNRPSTLSVRSVVSSAPHTGPPHACASVSLVNRLLDAVGREARDRDRLGQRIGDRAIGASELAAP